MTIHKTNTYFASDFHLGADYKDTSVDREKKIVRWLVSIEEDCNTLFLVGDVFDYWFEYKNSVPKGYFRLFGQLAKMIDSGTEIHFFVGNHDMWVKDYFLNELGIFTHFHPKTFEIDGQVFFIGHGDGLGPGDFKYKAIKKVIRNPLAQWMYGWLHPNLGLPIMKFFSQHSRDSQGEEPIKNIEQEWLVRFCEDHSKTHDVDFYIFGHRHIPIWYNLKNKKSTYINLGEWLEFCTYGKWNGKEMSILFFENEKAHKIQSF